MDNSLDLRDQFILARWAYSVGKPVIADNEYNILQKTFEQLNPDDEYSNRSWSSDPCPTALLERIGRQDLIAEVILSDKTESIPSLNTDWDLKNELGNVSEDATLSMKHDGWNVQANYYNGYLVNVHTRGRSTDSVDVSGIAQLFPNTIPFKGKCKVVSELTISKNDFITCARLFGNVSSRSAVSTVLARPDYYNLLSVHSFAIHGYDLQGKCKFEVLKDWGFNTPMYFKVKGFDDVLYYMQQLSEAEPEYGSPTDGVVYDGVATRAIRLLAWEEPIYYSYVSGYYEQFGPYRISPSVEIYPVTRNGVTQQRVNLTNWQRIIQNRLEPGSPIAFRVASGAIADFDEKATSLMQMRWAGQWESYDEEIRCNEQERKMMWQSKFR